MTILLPSIRINIEPELTIKGHIYDNYLQCATVIDIT